MNKRLSAVLMTLVIVFNSLLSIMIPATKTARADSLSATQFVDSVQVTDSNYQPITTNKISEDSTINIEYQLTIPSGKDIETSQPYTMPLPRELNTSTTKSFPITGANGVVLGQVTVENGEVKILFTNAVNSLSNIKIDFSFGSSFNKDQLDFDNGNDLTFPTKNNPTNSQHINFSKTNSGGPSSGNSSIAKNLNYDDNDDSIVNWTITINKVGDHVDNAILTDTMSNTQDYIPGSTTITYRNFKESPIKTEKTDLSFTKNSDGSQSTSKVFGELISKAEAKETAVTSIVIHYQTKLHYNSANNKYPNVATLANGDQVIDDATSTAKLPHNGGTGTGDQAGDVTVKYVDEAGNPLAEDVILSGYYGDAYHAEEKSFDGYVLKKVEGNPEGTFTDSEQTVTYVYAKKVPGDVVVKYVDENGNPLAKDIILSGEIGAAYSSDQKSFAGYTFKEVKGQPSGQFTDQEQVVTYVYQKNPVDTDHSTNTDPGTGDVVIEYHDDNGNKIADDDVVTGKIGDTYTINPKHIDGYTVKDTIGNLSGKFSDKNQTVSFTYLKNKKGLLPQTGEVKRNLMLSVLGLILVASTMLVFKFRRKQF